MLGNPAIPETDTIHLQPVNQICRNATIPNRIRLATNELDVISMRFWSVSHASSESAMHPTTAVPHELDRLEGQLERLRVVLSAILELAEELQPGTIERVLAKSD